MKQDVYLITGASSDIGLGLLKALSGEPITILAHYCNGLSFIENFLKSHHGRAQIIPVNCDFKNSSEMQPFAQNILDKYGPPNKIVHLPAALLKLDRFSAISIENLQIDFDIQVKSIAILLRAFLPLLAKRKIPGSVVIMLSSIVVQETPPKYLSSYLTTKYALLGLTKAVAAEYSEFHININAVSPSMIATKFIENIPAKAKEIAAAESPKKELLCVQDVMGPILFLLSDAAKSICGTNILMASNPHLHGF